MNSQATKKTYLFYTALTMLACVSLIFTNLSYDAEYQLAMAYRMIKGDSMITQMWEPHQTSAFLCAMIMKFYLAITHTTTGIVLFTQMTGFVIRLGISLYLFKTLKSLTHLTSPTLIAAVMYLLISPKDLLVPEFSNMQLWFGTLMFLTLVQYYRTKKVWQLALSAVFLCLGVFSYPSFIISYAAIFFLLLRYSDRAIRDILIFTGICALIGGSFAGYLFARIGFDNLLYCLSSALAIEPSHTGGMAEKAFSHLLNAANILGVFACIAAAGFAAEKAVRFIRQKRFGEKTSFSWDSMLLISWYILMAFLLVNILRAENKGIPSYPLLFLLFLGFRKRSLLSDAEKPVYYSALWIGIMNLLATLLLSDHGVLQAIPYMHTAICVSVLPLYHWFKECSARPALRKLFLCAVHTFLLLTIFRCIYIHVPIYGRSQICSLSSDLALIRSGPAIGIITDEDGAARQRDSMKEWKEYIKSGDTIWILGDPVDTLGYLYEDVEVGAPSVMSTPTYNSELLCYWEINPEKYPDVVIVSSGFGELAWDMLKNEWLMNWLEKEYCAETIIDGSYWRYYFKNQR